MITTKHYIRVDSRGNIIKGFSDAFEQPQVGDICINTNGGRHFELIGNVNPTLFSNQVPVYKYVNGAIGTLTPAEITTYKASLPVPIDPDADLSTAINSAVTVDDLKKALLGSLLTGQKGKAKGRIT